MSTTWATIAGLTVVTAVIKGVGPVFLGGRDLPALVTRAIPLIAPAILAALVVIGTFTAADGSLQLDARAAGLAAAACVLIVNRRSLVVTVCAAAAVAALLRALG